MWVLLCQVEAILIQQGLDPAERARILSLVKLRERKPGGCVEPPAGQLDDDDGSDVAAHIAKLMPGMKSTDVPLICAGVFTIGWVLFVF